MHSIVEEIPSPARARHVAVRAANQVPLPILPEPPAAVRRPHPSAGRSVLLGRSPRQFTRAVCVAAFALLIICGFAEFAWAQPNVVAPAQPEFSRSEGMYFSITKFFLVLLVFLLWVKSADWVSYDAQMHKLSWELWNMVYMASFILGFGVVMFIPIFFLGYPVFVLTWLLPLVFYVVGRNKKVNMGETVFTGDHLRYWFATKLNMLGFKIEVERKTIDEEGPPLKFVPTLGDDVLNNAAILTVRQTPVYNPAKQLVLDCVQRRAEQLLLDFTATTVAAKIQIDGIWMELPGMDRPTGDAMLMVYKTLGGLNVNDRQNRQEGKFEAHNLLPTLQKYQCGIFTQGTEFGERMVIKFSQGKNLIRSPEELGMPAAMQEKFRELTSHKNVFGIISAPPGGGFTSQFDSLVMFTDRFTRPFIGLEPLGNQERDLENVPVTTYDLAAGETPDKILPKLVRAYPEFFIVRDFVNAETINFLCDQCTNFERGVLGGTRAKDAAEAILRVMALKCDREKFANVVTFATCERMLRKLCTHCKIQFQPPPQIIQQLRLPPTTMFFGPPPPPQDPKLICKECGGIGYVGRTAIFELLVVNDAIREVLKKSPRLDILRATSRKAGNKNLQDEGLQLVVQGVTSYDEVARVLSE